MTASPQAPGFELVPATAADGEALAALRVEAMRESLQRVGRFDAARARARFLDTYSPDETLRIVERDALIGLVVLRRDAQGLLLGGRRARAEDRPARLPEPDRLAILAPAPREVGWTA